MLNIDLMPISTSPQLDSANPRSDLDEAEQNASQAADVQVGEPDHGAELPAGLHRRVEALRQHPRLGNELVHVAYLPGQAAQLREPRLPTELAEALASSGVEKLWSHQAEALAAMERGENVLVTTPTASGKSLIFQVPVLQEALAEGPGRALFLFPLKALGQDQKGKLDNLRQAAGLDRSEAACEIYDGDTPPNRRAAIRRNPPRVLITNPDMMHLGLLPHAGSWQALLADLRWLVLDELHTYRGIFGSHFHHVLQRLFRQCRLAGSDPQIIASSATAENAADFAHSLTGKSFTWVRETGAPREDRVFLLFQPETSPYSTVLRLFVEVLEAGMKTIVFTKARRITELLYSWLRQQQPELARRVACYRSGFLPEERRKIEGALFTGDLDGVISTSALEMGIDVGGLDACILVGYPGSMMATWQRSGRVGRAGRPSLTALVALPDALDQYFLAHPQRLLERPCELLVTDPDNEAVSGSHLVCAAAETPLEKASDSAYLERHAARIGELLHGGELMLSAEGDALHARRRRPQRDVHLRGTGRTYPVIEAGKNRTVGTVDGGRVLSECHPGAVYLHGGRQFLVEELDLDAHRVIARREKLDYFTTPLNEKETEILEVVKKRRDGNLAAWLGRLKVTERVIGYERKRLKGQEVIGQHPVDLPPVSYETVGLWWAAPRPLERLLRAAGEHFLGALHASEHAAISLLPLRALCDRNDIGGISYPYHPQIGCGAVFIYDGHPGGVGLAQRAFDDLPRLLEQVRQLLQTCPCEEGCPSCVQSPKCGNGNRPLDKAGALHVLSLLAEESLDDVGEHIEHELALAGLGEADRSGGEGGRISRRAIYNLPQPEQPLVQEVLGDQVLAPAPGPGPRHPLSEARQASDGTARSGNGSSSAAQTMLDDSQSPPAAAAADETTGRGRSKPRRAASVRRQQPSQNTVLFDLETLRSAKEVGGWHRSHRMGVAVGVVCHLQEDRFEVYREEDVSRLSAVLRQADLVVGYNIERFDYQVLNGYTGLDYGRLLPTLDLCQEVHRSLGRRLSMDQLAQATLGHGKTADGLQSLEWVREGRFDLVEEYCRQDVEVVRDLYLFGRREGYLCYRDRRSGESRRIAVDWQ